MNQKQMISTQDKVTVLLAGLLLGFVLSFFFERDAYKKFKQEAINKGFGERNTETREWRWKETN